MRDRRTRSRCSREDVLRSPASSLHVWELTSHCGTCELEFAARRHEHERMKAAMRRDVLVHPNLVYSCSVCLGSWRIRKPVQFKLGWSSLPAYSKKVCGQKMHSCGQQVHNASQLMTNTNKTRPVKTIRISQTGVQRILITARNSDLNRFSCIAALITLILRGDTEAG